MNVYVKIYRSVKRETSYYIFFSQGSLSFARRVHNFSLRGKVRTRRIQIHQVACRPLVAIYEITRLACRASFHPWAACNLSGSSFGGLNPRTHGAGWLADWSGSG